MIAEKNMFETLSGTSTNKSDLKIWPKGYFLNTLSSNDCFTNSRVLILKIRWGTAAFFNKPLLCNTTSNLSSECRKKASYHHFRNLSIFTSLFHLVFFSITTTLYYRVYPNSEKNFWPLVLRNFPKDCAAPFGRLRVPRRSLVLKAEKTIMVTFAVLDVVLGGNFRWPTLFFSPWRQGHARIVFAASTTECSKV